MARATHVNFLEENLDIVFLLVVLAILVGSLFFLNRLWSREQTRLAHVSGIMKESCTFSKHLVKHFLPSFKVENYQFRGMKPKKSTISIGFKNLSLELPNGSRVLKDVTGELKAGRMCAIMGPSGAGKTTFMNVLCGKANYGKMGGAILINGTEGIIASIKSVVGFVPQDDTVHEDLTVREQIEFSARLRNEASISVNRVRRIADDVLTVMQIDHIQNSIVGGVEHRGISGGQRKRVNIGLELAALPTVLFLDEPTSGLDATSSLAVALSLHKMCELGMTSIMVIHQPRYSLFTLFDDILLLGKGGQTVYLGPSVRVKDYFESIGFTLPCDENPADWFMDVITGEEPNEKIPDFKPVMLFGLWDQAKDGVFGLSPDGVMYSRSASHNLFDPVILAQKLAEEWDRIDTNRDGFLQEGELKVLLANCAYMMPDDAIVRELFLRMAGESSTSVSKEGFVDYLYSLQGDIARDRLLDAQSPGRLVEIDIDVLDDDVSDQTNPTDSIDSLRRAIPGYRAQMRVLVWRGVLQWWRQNPRRLLFLSAVAMGSLVLAVLDQFILEAPAWGGMCYLNTHTALGLLVSIFCLQVFGNDRLVFWRERSNGLSVLAFYVARTFIDGIDILVQSFLFTALYFLIRQPPVDFCSYFMAYSLVTWVASGWGYFVSTIVPPEHGPFVVSLIIFIICGLLGNPHNLAMFLDGGLMEMGVSAISITRWSVAMNFNLMAKAIAQEPLNGPVGPEMQGMFEFQKEIFETGIGDLGCYWQVVIVLTTMGTVLRVLGFLGLFFCNRRKAV